MKFIKSTYVNSELFCAGASFCEQIHLNVTVAGGLRRKALRFPGYHPLPQSTDISFTYLKLHFREYVSH
jgi:hypothetical protein